MWLFLFQSKNITEKNKTQGIMEKSQWDLKHIRFRSSRLTRLDDFVIQYQKTHTALLKEYEDSKRVIPRKVCTFHYYCNWADMAMDGHLCLIF